MLFNVRDIFDPSIPRRVNLKQENYDDVLINDWNEQTTKLDLKENEQEIN